MNNGAHNDVGVYTQNAGDMLGRTDGIGVMANTQTSEILQNAARLAVDEGMDWGGAKRRALRELGLPARTPLPDNLQMEDAVREHIAIFHADTQPRELHLLRVLALEWMRRMQAFRPYLGGAAWWGTATRRSDVVVALFCDDPKSAEIELINQRVRYEPGRTVGLRGEPVDVLAVHVHSAELDEDVTVQLLVYDLDDLRGALRADPRGRAPRGDIAAVQLLLGGSASATLAP